MALWSSQRFPTGSNCRSTQPRQNSIQALSRPTSRSLTTLFPVSLPQWSLLENNASLPTVQHDWVRQKPTRPKAAWEWTPLVTKEVCVRVCVSAVNTQIYYNSIVFEGRVTMWLADFPQYWSKFSVVSKLTVHKFNTSNHMRRLVGCAASETLK